MEDRNLQGEVLYLVYNLLKDTSLNVADLTNTVNAFENELNASNLMGETVLWDGSVKTRTLDDMKKKHSQIPSDLLLKHLQKLLILTSKGQASASTSLLALENNKYDDPITRNLCRLKCINVIETIQEIQNKNSELKKLSVRILSIDENLAEMNEPDDSHTSALKFMGMTKEKKELLRRTETLRLETIALNSDLHEHKDGLRRMGRLGGESYRGVCNSLSCWLNNRQLGNVNSAFSGAANALGRVLQLTACHHRLKLLTDFKLHYITSGHYLTPAYCAVTDKSGRYALTGADDTLVKVWDLETGRLRITLRGHKGYITFIAVSPDNSLVATSCTFGDIRLWRLRDGECVCALRHLGCVNWMKFDDLTNSLASGGDDGFAYVWCVLYPTVYDAIFISIFICL
jgi:WD40 repeat protein